MRRLIQRKRAILMIITDIRDKTEVRNRAYKTKSNVTLIRNRQQRDLSSDRSQVWINKK